jgi:uncharacterized membrane protein
MKALSVISHPSRPISSGARIVRLALGFARHWLFLINLSIGVWVGLPWLAPAFMHWGWTGTAHAIYFLYSFQCHQLPERSFFLFGRQSMYSLSELQAAGADITSPSLLRQFIGNAEMGWKVAWSDRMVSMYSSILLFGLFCGLVRDRLKPLSLRGFVLMLLPMAMDGGTHAISDLAGIGQGFRDTNMWLAQMTGNYFSNSFYVGDTLGSFNSWARLITGLLFGLAIVWLAYPYMKDFFADYAHELEAKLERAGFQK